MLFQQPNIKEATYMRKLIALLLTLALVISLVPAAFAAEAYTLDIYWIANVNTDKPLTDERAAIEEYLTAEDPGKTELGKALENAKILAGDAVIEGRYAETLPADAFQTAEAELGDIARCEEDVLSYIAFPPVAEKFFEARKEQEERRVAYSITKAEE